MNKKYIIATVIILTLGTGIFAFRQQQTVIPSGNPTSATPTTSEKTAGTSISIPVLKNETVLQAMRAYASSSVFRFTGKLYPSLGFFVESISSKKNAGGFYWTLYIDGTLSELGASNARVTSGQFVEWRYQKGAE